MKKVVKKKQAFPNYLKNTFWQFIEHVLINKKVLLSTIYDIIFWLLFFGTSYITSSIVKKEAAMLGRVSFDQFKILTSQDLTQTNIDLIKAFMLKSIIILLAFIIVILVIYTLMKGLIWLTLLDKKITRHYFEDFMKLNIVWTLLWILPILFVLVGSQPEVRNYFVIFFFLFYIHSTTILQTMYTQTYSIKNTLTAVLTIGIAKIHYFIVPYAFSILIYWLLTRLLALIPTGTLLLVTAILIGLLFISWFRNYIKDIILQIY